MYSYVMLIVGTSGIFLVLNVIYLNWKCPNTMPTIDIEVLLNCFKVYGFLDIIHFLHCLILIQMHRTS
jgi:hypothetical protein